MPLIIPDSSCLIILERIDQLSLLRTTYPDLMMPPAVATEFGRPLTWLPTQPVADQALVASLRTQLGWGEAEVLALALEHSDCAVLLDEKKARRLAHELHIRRFGTLGLILQAKQKGTIRAVKPLIDRLIAAQFRVSQALYDEVLRLANETSA